MIKTITENDFIQAFEDSSRADQFSFEALQGIYELFEECMPDFELDIVAICCDFTEYESLDECLDEYSSIESEDELHDNTLVISLSSGGVVIQNF